MQRDMFPDWFPCETRVFCVAPGRENRSRPERLGPKMAMRGRRALRIGNVTEQHDPVDHALIFVEQVTAIARNRPANFHRSAQTPRPEPDAKTRPTRTVVQM